MSAEKVYLDEDGLARVLGKFVRTQITPPILTNGSTYTYDGMAKTPSFTGIDNEKMVVKSVAASFVNAGIYTIVIGIKDSQFYMWDDGTDTDKEYYFTISKAQTTLTIDKDSVSLSDGWPGVNDDVLVINNNGIIKATSSDPTVATASVSGNVVKIIAKGNGTATITITDTESNNYLSSQRNVSVTCNGIKPVYSWVDGTDAQIVEMIAAADNGEIDLYEDAGWRIGDKRSVTLPALGSVTGWPEAAAQTIDLVLVHRKKLAGNEGNFVVALDGLLNVSGNWTQAGQVPNYNLSYIKNYLESVVYENIGGLKDIFKSVDIKGLNISYEQYWNVSFFSYRKTGESVVDISGLHFLPQSAKEFFGGNYGNTTMTADEEQLDYYKDPANLPIDNGGAYVCTRTPTGGMYYIKNSPIIFYLYSLNSSGAAYSYTQASGGYKTSFVALI